MSHKVCEISWLIQRLLTCPERRFSIMLVTHQYIHLWTIRNKLAPNCTRKISGSNPSGTLHTPIEVLRVLSQYFQANSRIVHHLCQYHFLLYNFQFTILHTLRYWKHISTNCRTIIIILSGYVRISEKLLINCFYLQNQWSFSFA
jgi:hypothetical protein